MKTLIATAIIALASGAASADYLSFADSSEFYSGQPGSTLSTQTRDVDPAQFLEGNYAGIVQSGSLSSQGDRIGAASSRDADLYVEGNWDV